MNTIWSTLLQKKETLYQTRRLRFDDCFKDEYIKAFKIENQRRILEIGADPGALTQALKRWYPDKYIVGSDRDTNFVKFAGEQAPDIEFVEADATALPFPDCSFDVTISNTVQEHIEPAKFFGEQYRVLSDGGLCLVLSARRGINIVSDVVSSVTDSEKALYDRTEKYYQAADEIYGVGRFACSEQDLPKLMSEYGFKNIHVSYLAINLTPDSAQYSPEFAVKMIEANRRIHLDSLEYLPHIASDVVSESEITEWAGIINKKYDKRLDLYKQGQKQWDANVSVTMVLRGVK